MINYTAEEIREFTNLSDGYMSDFLHNLRSKSFHHQEKLQIDGVIMERVSFTINDFVKRIRKTKATTVTKYDYTNWIDYPFINPSRKMAIKRADLISHEVNFYDISDNRELFDKNYMAFIDGKLVDFITILVRLDGIEFVLNVNESGNNSNGLPYREFKDMRERNVDIDIVFFSNNSISPVNPDRQTILSNTGHLKSTIPGLIESLSDDQTFLSFVRDEISGTSVNLHHSTNKERLVRFYEEYNKKSSNKKGFINIYGFKNLSEIIDIESYETVIQIPGYSMPVPAENILVFKVNERGEYSYTNSVTLTHKFPNFYEVHNPTEEDLALLVFFSDINTTNIGFYNAIKSYYKYNGDNLNAFINAPDEIRNFIPDGVEFSIKDFDQVSGINDPLYYKVSKLEELVLKDPEHLRSFLKEQHVNGDGFYVDMSKIDLSKRVRRDTVDEARDANIAVKFEEDHYLLTFKELTSGGTYRATIFVDGCNVIPTHTFDMGIYTHVYIPTRLVKENSIVEVERSRVKLVKFTNHTFRANNPLLLRLDPFTLAVNDFDFMDANTGESIPRSNFTFVSGGINYNGRPNDPIRQSSIHIECKNVAYLNREIKVVYGRGFDTHTMIAKTDGPGIVFNIKGQGFIERGRIRAFHNGKKIPTYSIDIRNGVDADTVKVSLLVEHKAGDQLTLEYSPNDRNIIMDMRNIPEDGVINFYGFIDKPFDLSWYDIYVNGRKLSRANVDYITPYIIRLKNLESNRSLSVYEVVRPIDIITLSGDRRTVIDEMWENDDAFYKSVVNSDNNVIDIEDDIVSESVSWYTQKLKDLLGEVITIDTDPTGTKFYHIQPDINQVPYNMKYKYDHIIDNGVVKIDSGVIPKGVSGITVTKMGG